MKNNDQVSRVRAVREYLAGIGITVSVTQGYEVLARALGYSNKHVLAASDDRDQKDRSVSMTNNFAQPILPASQRYTRINDKEVYIFPLESHAFSVDDMVKMDWNFSVVIPVPVELVGSIDKLNEYASKLVTGNDSALEDLNYSHRPEIHYGQDFIAYHLTAYVSDPAYVFGDVCNSEDAAFYKDLGDLFDSVKEGASATITVLHDNSTVDCVISEVAASPDKSAPSPLGLLMQYAASNGANNDAVNASKDVTAFVLTPITSTDLPPLQFDLNTLKYAVKTAERTWTLHSVSIKFPGK